MGPDIERPRRGTIGWGARSLVGHRTVPLRHHRTADAAATQVPIGCRAGRLSSSAPPEARQSLGDRRRPTLAAEATPTLPSVATDQIVQSLSYITWALLGALSLGSMAMVWLLAQATDAARGFLVFSALMAGVIGILWFSTETSLPPPSQLAISAADELADARRLAIGAAAILAIVAGIRLRGGSTARWWGLGAIGAGVIAMAVAAWGWTDGTSMAVPYLVQLLALSAVTGGSLAALVLSHWYLVTPRISERPLLLATRVLIATLVIQLLLFATWQVVGARRRRSLRCADRPERAPRLAAAHRRAPVPPRAHGHGLPNGPDALDGIGDRPALHRVRGRAGVDDRRRGPDARRGPARMRMWDR